MSKKAKLISVLISALLLVACISGILVLGAGAEEITVPTSFADATVYDYTQNSGSHIAEALQKAAQETWAADSKLVIKFYYKDETSLLSGAEGKENLAFGCPTIFREDGTKLPILIMSTRPEMKSEIQFKVSSVDKDGNPTVVDQNRAVAFANDYTFYNLTILVGSNKDRVLYAGSGNVVFEKVDFGPKSEGKLYGDNFTKQAYIGWEDHWNGTDLIESSLTLGEGVKYNVNFLNLKGNVNIAAVGYGASDSAMLQAFSVLQDDVNQNYIDNGNYLLPDDVINEKKAAAKLVTFKNNEIETAPDVRPINTKASVIVDTKTQTPDDSEIPEIGCSSAEKNAFAEKYYEISRIAVRKGPSPVADATVEIRSGIVAALEGDNHSADNQNAIKEEIGKDDNGKPIYQYHPLYETFVGNTTLNLFGGCVYHDSLAVRLLRDSSLIGNLSINIDQKFGVETKIQWIQPSIGSQDVVYGDYAFTMKGGNLYEYYGAPDASGKIKNSVSGGVIDNFSATRSCALTNELTNNISGGTFTNTFYAAFNGAAARTESDAALASVITEVYGGTFESDFVASPVPYSRNCNMKVIGNLRTRIFSGTFYGDVFVSKNTGGADYHSQMYIRPSLSASKKPLVFYGKVGLSEGSVPSMASEVKLGYCEDPKPIQLGASAQIFFDMFYSEPNHSATKNIIVEQLEYWQNGINYLTLNGELVSGVEFEFRQKEKCGSIVSSTNDGVTVWTGKFPIYGATLLLGDRIQARVYFDPKQMGSSWTYTITCPDGTVIAGNQSDSRVTLTESGYALTLPAVAAADFHEEFTVSTGKTLDFSFSILQLCRNAIDLEYTNQTPALRYLFKSIYNYGLEACTAFHGEDCFETNRGIYTKTKIQDEYLKLQQMKFGTEKAKQGAFQFNGSSLVLNGVVGLQIYGTCKEDLSSASLLINGTVLSADAYSFQKITPSEANLNSNYRFTLRINALSLSKEFDVTVKVGSESNPSTIKASVPAACNLYVEGEKDYKAARSLLAYIEAVYHYFNADEVLSYRKQKAYDEMVRVTNTVWTPAYDIEFIANNNYYLADGTVNPDADPNQNPNAMKPTKLNAGYYYAGIPYTHGAGSLGALFATGKGQTDSKGAVIVNPTFEMMTGAPNFARIGNDCNDAVFWAWAASCYRIYNEASESCTEEYGIIPVGGYELKYYDVHAWADQQWPAVQEIVDGKVVTSVNPNRPKDASKFDPEKVSQYPVKTVSLSLKGITSYIWFYNGFEKMFKAFAALEPGDGLVYHVSKGQENGDAGHLAMIQKVVVVYCTKDKAYTNFVTGDSYTLKKGDIDPGNSYILVADQGGTTCATESGIPSENARYWDAKLGDWVYQSMNFNRDLNGDGKYENGKKGASNEFNPDGLGREVFNKIYFDDLVPRWKDSKNEYSEAYIPVSPIDFYDSTPIPSIEVKDSLEGEDITMDNVFTGTITANRRISHVEVSILDEDGNVVKSTTIFGIENEYNTGRNGLYIFDFARAAKESEELRMIGDVDLYGLPKGKKYTLVATAQLGANEIVEVRRFTFKSSSGVVTPIIPAN